MRPNVSSMALALIFSNLKFILVFVSIIICTNTQQAFYTHAHISKLYCIYLCQAGVFLESAVYSLGVRASQIDISINFSVFCYKPSDIIRTTHVYCTEIRSTSSRLPAKHRTTTKTNLAQKMNMKPLYCYTKNMRFHDIRTLSFFLFTKKKCGFGYIKPSETPIDYK